ncbi:MAG: hypothetical protein LBS83_00820 [Holosporales bacterium]|nr:hypothetical protein [Holosporales bacterium]
MPTKILQTFKLPGNKPIVIPIVGIREENEQNGISKATNDCLIVFKFQNDKIKNTELYGWDCSLSRESIGNPVVNFFPASATHASELSIVIGVNKWMPLLEQAMNSLEIFPTIKVQKYGWVKGELSVVNEVLFSTCCITYMQQILDYVVFRARFCQIDETMYIYDQKGEDQGQVVSSVSLEKGEMTYGEGNQPNATNLNQQEDDFPFWDTYV